MKNAITVARFVSQSSSSISFSSISPLSFITRKKGAAGSMRLVQNNAMDKSSKNPIEITPDLMEASFGEGYATRSDEEGFGGIYGGKCSGECEVEAKSIPDPAGIDTKQGSEVKEKEKARNRPRAD